jgi:acetyl/propionyl-CoA carboxylase alpha subunit
MSRVDRAEDLPAALAEGRRVSEAAFGDGTVYLERLLEGCGHVEVQVFGDSAGRIAHLFERECSVQRRHQKIVEETPSPALDATLRAAMGRAAVRAAKTVGYVGAGTAEFLLDEDRRFYFLEMNTRLQSSTRSPRRPGVRPVRAQLDIARAPPASAGLVGWDARAAGHAIGCVSTPRIPASSRRARPPPRIPRAAGAPGSASTGRRARQRRGPRVRPLLAKLIVWAPDREAAIGARTRRALRVGRPRRGNEPSPVRGPRVGGLASAAGATEPRRRPGEGCGSAGRRLIAGGRGGRRLFGAGGQNDGRRRGRAGSVVGARAEKLEALMSLRGWRVG